MNKSLILILMAGLLGLGCQTTTYRKAQMDANYGRAYETARFSQIQTPEAQNNLDPVTGFDGTAALNARDKYQKDFKKQISTSQVFNINVSK